MDRTVRVKLSQVPGKELTIRAKDMTTFLHELYFTALCNNSHHKVEAKFGSIVVSMYIEPDE